MPSWFLISRDDRLIPPTLQQMFANRMNATTDTIPTSSYASLVSHPHEVFELIQAAAGAGLRSEEHTSELQSPYELVCRLLLEKKKTSLQLHIKTTNTSH